ncbi:MAG: hypothetical protein A2542_01205 [Parcubacteria group bacterium RIFOXYD2_FULL_52_8]|nr:MAG: hypothetical protein A2542_01205 [Parcubacteria group bacterium RIFOXYD2_FULL_52_8]
MFKRNRGLGSGVGTFTHVESGSVPWRANRDSTLSAIRKKSIRDARRELTATRYCTTCRATINRGTQSDVVWAKVRICRTCADSRRRPESGKFCKHCGKFFSRAEIDALHQAKIALQSALTPYQPKLNLMWVGWSTCEPCKTIHNEELPQVSRELGEDLAKKVKITRRRGKR